MNEKNIEYTPELLSGLQSRIESAGLMDERRLRHTLGVSGECGALARLFGFSEGDVLRLSAAGLLHDITKQRSLPDQLELCRRYGISYPAGAEHSPKVFHGWTAAALALDEYAEYCDAEMAQAIYEHTTGGENMSLFSMLLYLADYIEPGRTFPDCVRLREYFYAGAQGLSGDESNGNAPKVDVPNGDVLNGGATNVDAPNGDVPNGDALYMHLLRTLLLSFDMTVRGLLDDGEELFPMTAVARNSVLRRIHGEA